MGSSCSSPSPHRVWRPNLRQVREIAEVTAARLRPLGLDGLILYDIADEAERTPAERPFPFMPTLDPADYLADHLTTWPTPVIVYRAVGKYTPDELCARG